MVNASRGFPCDHLPPRARFRLLAPSLASRRMHGVARLHQTGDGGAGQICRHLLLPQRSPGRQRADAREKHHRAADICRNAGCSCIATIRHRRLTAWSSRGVTFGQHQDMPENASGDDFGPPGSGLPRCSTGGKEFTAGAAAALLGQPRTRRQQHSLHRLARRAGLSVSSSPTTRTGSSSRTMADRSPASTIAAPT